MMKKPQISVRTLLVLTAVLAIAIGWLADRQRFKNQLREAAGQELQQRQKIFAMEREIEQLKANASPHPDFSWRLPGNQQAVKK